MRRNGTRQSELSRESVEMKEEGKDTNEEIVITPFFLQQ